MFSKSELAFLTGQLGSFIEKAQSKLDGAPENASGREGLEINLITLVSIVNKLEHLQPESSKDKSSLKLLIVDDVKSMRDVLRHYFMALGLKNVDMAEDGHKGFLMLKNAHKHKKPYDLVVSDWEMPRMTGLELLKKVRTDSELWRTPLYLISSLSEQQHIVKALNMGATGYLTKPVNQNMVKSKFSEYLN